MTDTDENLLTVAKLREQVRGDLAGDPRLGDHAGISLEPHHDVFSWLSNNVEPWFGSSLETEVLRTHLNRAASRAVRDDKYGLASYIVGVTETDMQASQIQILLDLLQKLENHGAPTIVSGKGNPESGKTNSMFVLVELLDAETEDLLVMSNIRSWSRNDIHVSGMHDLVVESLRHRDKPKAVVIDEASTHFDARTNRYEVATQLTPTAKRFAKMNIDFFGAICHSGMDLHPEVKRLTTLAYHKHSKENIEFFNEWDQKSDHPTDSIFGSIEPIAPCRSSYDPDDSSPWSWDLEPDIFQLDLEWTGLFEHLCEKGPRVD